MHHLSGPPSLDLAGKLAAFEEQFIYPLGPGRHFRITHGEDYPRFFRAMGEAVCFVVEQEDRVAGTLGMAIRRLTLPDGTVRRAAYFGDLKITPAARGGVALMRLVRAAGAWGRPRAEVAFGVVMDGTSVTPDAYTGRAGIPPFGAVGKVIVLRLLSGEAAAPAEWLHDTAAGMECFQRLSRGRFFCGGATPAERSESEPTWLVDRDGQACGLFEDTRRAKRLIADDGTELRSAHLSYFAYSAPSLGSNLLRSALTLVGRRGFPALFVAVAQTDAAALQAALADVTVITAPATVYAMGLPAQGAWNINTAEI